MTTATRDRVGSTLTPWIVGSVLLAGLVVGLLSGLEWPEKIGLWILLVLLLDECGAWFGYTGVAVGLLPLFVREDGSVVGLGTVGSFTPTLEWTVLFPLVGSALIGALLVRHAGGLLALPLSLVAYALPIVLVRLIGPQLDASVTLPASRLFVVWTVWPAIAGTLVSLVRRLLIPAGARV